MSNNRLNCYAAEIRLKLFDELMAGHPPSRGAFDEHVLKDGRAKGSPQMGATRYEPEDIIFEFIYPDPLSSATVFEVKIEAPERIVFLPVPDWVIENIWQGDISGSYQFESDAIELVEAFRGELSLESNPKWFLPQAAKRRE
jgi:hypothetical protein